MMYLLQIMRAGSSSNGSVHYRKLSYTVRLLSGKQLEAKTFDAIFEQSMLDYQFKFAMFVIQMRDEPAVPPVSRQRNEDQSQVASPSVRIT